MTEPIKLPPVDLNVCKRVHARWPDPSTPHFPREVYCVDYDTACRAVGQATADLRAELARVTESARITIERLRDEGNRAEAERDKARAELARLTKVLQPAHELSDALHDPTLEISLATASRIGAKIHALSRALAQNPLPPVKEADK